MFKKSDNAGDKTPKPATAENVAKVEAPANQPAPAAAKVDAPAAEAKKS